MNYTSQEQMARKRASSFTKSIGTGGTTAPAQVEQKKQAAVNTGTRIGGPAADASNRPRKFKTTRGKRKLSFAEAYSHRTTDTSRARVMALYGRSKPPAAPKPKSMGKPKLGQYKPGPNRNYF